MAEAEKVHEGHISHKSDNASLKEENKKLLNLLSTLEKNNESLKEDLYFERSKNSEIEKSLRRVAKIHIGTEYTDKVRKLVALRKFIFSVD